MREALRLLDEVGFDGLTTRRLAERLGIQSPSLYNHARDKQELLTLMANAICQEVSPAPARSSWRKKLEAIGGDYRRVLLCHRDTARIMLSTQPLGPDRLQLIERVGAHPTKLSRTVPCPVPRVRGRLKHPLGRC